MHWCNHTLHLSKQGAACWRSWVWQPCPWMLLCRVQHMLQINTDIYYIMWCFRAFQHLVSISLWTLRLAGLSVVQQLPSLRKSEVLQYCRGVAMNSHILLKFFSCLIKAMQALFSALLMVVTAFLICFIKMDIHSWILFVSLEISFVNMNCLIRLNLGFCFYLIFMLLIMWQYFHFASIALIFLTVSF